MDLNNAYTILVYFSAFSVIVPLLLAVKTWRYLQWDSICLTVYLCVSLVTEIVLIYFSRKGFETTAIVNVFSLAEFLFISVTYYLALSFNKYLRLFFLFSVLGMMIIFFASDIEGSMNTFNGFYTFSLLLLALYYFYKETKEATVERLADHYFFWFNAAFLLYFGFSFFIFISDDFIINADRDVARVLWTFHLIINMIFYSVLSIGIWKLRGKQP